MQAKLSFRKLVRKQESFIKARKSARDLSHWKKTSALNPSNRLINAHVMLTSDIRYVDLAEVCIHSFLHFHPNAKFIVHCDKFTRAAVEEKFYKELECGKVILRLIDNKAHMSWQEQKLDLILGMSGTADLMLDADLRWNGALATNFDKVLFLVKEFEFEDKSPFREIIKTFELLPARSSMKNVSIFSFGGYTLSKHEMQFIQTIMNQYRVLVESDIVGKLDKNAVGRVIEQFSLSICSELWNSEIAFVKERDLPLDGGVVESCYFGATGGLF